MLAINEKDVVGGRRTVMQTAKLAIRDIYDAIIELVTNADDRYQRLKVPGRIEIEIERGRGEHQRILRVRDFADGMTLSDMDEKLSRTGGRVSGMEEGFAVRGTNSRGAKDIAALGSVTFESIAHDGLYHKCEITRDFVFKPHGSRQVTAPIRKSIGIRQGTGMLVTVKLGRNHTVPRHDNLRDKMQRLVSLRDILADPDRTLILRDVGHYRDEVLKAPFIEGHDRLKQTIEIAGYPGVVAKLVIQRAKRPFEPEPRRFRLGGILVKSRHAVHEATLVDTSLETNPHALWFYGKLVCEHIDELWNGFDERFEAGDEADPANQIPIIDPMRQSGLTRAHPFVVALFGEVLKRLRPLVEEERRREEKERATIESDATRRRLNTLEKAALKFMRDFGEDGEPARHPDQQATGSQFKERGYALNPPFVQMVLEHSQKFWLTVNQEAFPELEVGATVEVECLTQDLSSEKRFVGLEPHPSQEGVLRAVWNVKAVSATSATGLRARVGPINTESTIEVFETEADKYKHITTLCFSKKRYRISMDGKRKRLRVLAPLDLLPEPRDLEISTPSRHFEVIGGRQIKPKPRLGVAIADITVRSDGSEARSAITVRMGELEASAVLESAPSAGAPLKIQLEDVSGGNQRSYWRKNVLEIAARHPSLARYLGSKALNFPGQESKHFRLLLAEIVADAVCARLLDQNIKACPEDYEGADWDQYYAEYSKHMTRFLPIAHKVQWPEGE